ncbi:protein ATP6V1FNB [Alosa sapidissima]|uniref:protein ATP6V1FNB n=1 Tax=Alosa sapidissima TaxID=34773 RepID=UPI001C0957F5|nr:protein ATP6V1FNB [Alosa sapidissima]
MRSLLTTQNQNCYRELIMKEAYTRLAWKMRYGQDYPRSFTSHQAKAQGLPQLTVPKPVLPPLVSLPERKRVPSPKVKPHLSEAPLMRPITPETRDALYQGFSKEGKGRHLYLRHRVLKGPDERFDYPILSSWEYGWRLGDYEQIYRSPANGRSGIVRSTFYARNGIFNVPMATDRLG